jgi:hypothetical protein
MDASVKSVRMSMRDEYRTKAAEYEARALSESDRGARLHFESLADRNAQIDLIYEPQPRKSNSRR